MSGKTPAPSRRDRMRPVELLVMAAVFGLFVGAVGVMGARGWGVSRMMAGVAVIASLVILATLLIAVGPKIDDDRVDPVDPDAPTGSAGSVHRDPHRPRGH